MTRTSTIAVLVLLAACVVCAQAPKIAVPPVALSGAWSSVALPETPLGITVHDGAFWVCGANEMIARSSDGGREWVVLHDTPDGQMLFAIAYSGPDTVQAFGTYGIRLVSTDGGQSWRRSVTDARMSLTRVRFASPSVAYGVWTNGYATSQDGGAHWKMHGNSDSPASPVMAVTDAENAAVLQGTQLKETVDGGRRWKSREVPKPRDWSDLAVVGGAYRLFGGDGKQDGPSACGCLMAEASGTQWRVSQRLFGYGDCSAQGCRVEGGWVDLSGAKPVYWKLPDDNAEPLSGQWAAAGNVFCKVSGTLRCREGKEVWQPPVNTAADFWRNPQLTKQTNPGYTAEDKANDIQGTVVLGVMISADGLIHDEILLAAPTPGMAYKAEAAVLRWKFKPALKNGKPVEVEATVDVNFHLRF